MPLLTVAIPTYEMGGLGAAYLHHSLSVLSQQTFSDFNVVVSDHSRDNTIARVCDQSRRFLSLSYTGYTEQRGNPSANINNAIRHADGSLVKLLFQDDYLADNNALARIVEAFDAGTDHWLATACEHTQDGIHRFRPFVPRYTSGLLRGINTISSPSVITIRRDSDVWFDERLLWLMDCDFYHRLFLRFGLPKVLDTVGVVNRLGDHQVTNTLATRRRRREEKNLVKRKYRPASRERRRLPQVTLVAVSSIKIHKTVQALRHSMKGIDFGQVLLVSDRKPTDLDSEIRFVPCERIDSLNAYSRFMLYSLADHIDTDFALVVQHDGFVVRPDRWTNTFFQYDYVGAPWRIGAHFTPEGSPVRVGNGGFSLRSKKLLSAPALLGLEFTDAGTGYFNEDGVLCSYHRRSLEQFGIRFAPPEVASLFSLEDPHDDAAINPFGFHKTRKFMPLGTRLSHLW
jgi:glycosyltransferase involved in cell wall biosynthesis